MLDIRTCLHVLFVFHFLGFFCLFFWGFFNLLRWQLLAKSHRFQMHNSAIHHPYITLCVHHTGSVLCRTGHEDEFWNSLAWPPLPTGPGLSFFFSSIFPLFPLAYCVSTTLLAIPLKCQASSDHRTFTCASCSPWNAFLTLLFFRSHLNIHSSGGFLTIHHPIYMWCSSCLLKAPYTIFIFSLFFN